MRSRQSWRHDLGFGFASEVKGFDLGAIQSRSGTAKSKGSGLWVRQQSRRVRSECDLKSKGSRLWVRSLSGCDLSLSLYAWVQKWFEVKIFPSNHFRPTSLILQSTLKIFSVLPNFLDQSNSLFYGKAFLNLVWNQNKRSLRLSPCENNIFLFNFLCLRLMKGFYF